MRVLMARARSVLPAIALLAAGCGRGPAEQALKAAEAAFEAARPAVEKYVPAQIKPLTDAVAAARAELKRGNYKAALATAESLTVKTKAAAEAASRKKDELAGVFGGLKASLPGRVQALRKRLDALARNPALVADMDQETVATARANLDRLAEAWNDAASKFDRDDVVQAVEQAEKVRARLEEMGRAFLPAASASARR
jgi:DNA repair exonuclease SbcCD ATPase subunit